MCIFKAEWNTKYGKTMNNLASDIFINGDKVYLRAFESGDLAMLCRLENHPDPRETLFYALPTNTETQQEKVNALIKDPNTILFTICSKADNQPVGQTMLVRIDWVTAWCPVCGANLLFPFHGPGQGEPVDAGTGERHPCELRPRARRGND